MSIKPQASDTSDSARAAVWSGGVLELDGRDAGAFLQAQLMNDVRQLGDGEWQWTGWLNPKGRLIALAVLLRRSEQTYWLILPDYPADRLGADLRRFQFRSKFTLTQRDDLFLLPLWGKADAASGQVTSTRLVLGGESPRLLEIATLDPGPTDAAQIARWRVEDLAHGLPRLPESAIAAHTPQMLGLERLHAYSVKKGCYPGQEIVARTHFLGQAKRGLRRLVSDRDIPPGSEIIDAGLRLGEVLCSASAGDRHEALAVLPLEATGPGFAGPLGERLKVTDFAEGMHR